MAALASFPMSRGLIKTILTLIRCNPTIRVASKAGQGATFRLEIAEESVTEVAVMHLLPESADIRKEK